MLGFPVDDGEFAAAADAFAAAGRYGVPGVVNELVAMLTRYLTAAPAIPVSG